MFHVDNPLEHLLQLLEKEKKAKWKLEAKMGIIKNQDATKDSNHYVDDDDGNEEEEEEEEEGSSGGGGDGGDGGGGSGGGGSGGGDDGRNANEKKGNAYCIDDGNGKKGERDGGNGRDGESRGDGGDGEEKTKGTTFDNNYDLSKIPFKAGIPHQVIQSPSTSSSSSSPSTKETKYLSPAQVDLKYAFSGNEFKYPACVSSSPLFKIFSKSKDAEVNEDRKSGDEEEEEDEDEEDEVANECSEDIIIYLSVNFKV